MRPPTGGRVPPARLAAMVAVAVLVAALTSPARPAEAAEAEDAAPAAEAIPARTDTDVSAFHLGLETADLEKAGGFRLFAGAASEGVAADGRASRERAETGRDAADQLRQGLAASLAWNADPSHVPEGLRLRLKPLTWEDMDSWERAGYALHLASAVAGAAYLLSRLVD